MKKHILIILLLWVSLYSKAQRNLVGNGDFETNAGGSGFDGDPQCQHSTRLQWATVPPWDIPNITPICLKCWFSSPSCGLCVGSPDLGREFITTTTPNYWNYYGTTLGTEYILQKLPTPMIANHLYYIQFRAKNPSQTTASAFGGLHFNMKQPEQCSGNNIMGFGFYQPNVIFPAVDYADHNWHTESAYWVPKDNFTHMTLGEIRETVNNADFGVLWDDIKIFEVGSSDCPNFNFIQNLTFQNIGGILYKSQTLTSSGNNVDVSQTAGDVHITNTAEVKFISATQVALMPGFYADPGSTFSAFIAPCNNYACPQASAYIGGQSEYCSMAGQTVPLGGAGSGNETYAWTATGFNGANMSSYLTSTSSSNPVLTIPSGSGYINLTETVNNSCSGTLATDHLLLYYDNSPVTTPVISASPTSLTNNSTSFAFTIQGNAHTQNVYVTLNDLTSGGVVQEWDITDFPTVCNSSYQYNMSDVYGSFDPCHQYRFDVTSKNICSTNTSAAASITWQTGRLTGMGSVVSSAFVCTWGVPMTITAESIIYYDITVYNSWGQVMYFGSGNPNSAQTFQVYDGQCNGSWAACGGHNQASTGTYYYVLNLRNSCNYSQGFPGYLTLAYGCRTDSTAGTIDTTFTGGIQLNGKDTTHGKNTAGIKNLVSTISSAAVQVYPNPSAGLITLNVNAQHSSKLMLSISTAQGVFIVNKSYNLSSGDNSFDLDLSNYAKGVYFINITDENGVTIKNDKIILLGQ